MIPEGPLNQMVPLIVEDHGGGGGVGVGGWGVRGGGGGGGGGAEGCMGTPVRWRTTSVLAGLVLWRLSAFSVHAPVQVLNHVLNEVFVNNP